MGVETRTGRLHKYTRGKPGMGEPPTMILSPGKEAAVTRESKLALIIGFVLVLVVGVLVSDHFSQVSTMTLDTNQPDDGRVGVPITDLGQREQRGINSAIPPADTRYAISTPPAAQTQSPAQTPVEISNSQRQIQEQQLADAGDQGGSIIDRAFEEARRRVQETELPAAAQPSHSPLNQPQPGQVRTLPSPKYTSYTVVSGDSLIKLARRFLNDGERWSEIHELNADQLGPDAILKIGMTLRLPADARQAVKKAPIIPTPARPGDANRSYTVLPGDTLGQISMRLLGTSKRADEIARLNGLDSVNEIFAGMTLKIPAK